MVKPSSGNFSLSLTINSKVKYFFNCNYNNNAFIDKIVVNSIDVYYHLVALKDFFFFNYLAGLTYIFQYIIVYLSIKKREIEKKILG